MFYELFDWKIKVGIVLTIVLFMASAVCAVLIILEPAPTDALSATANYLGYRWLALFVATTIGLGSATIKYYNKRIRMH